MFRIAIKSPRTFWCVALNKTSMKEGTKERMERKLVMGKFYLADGHYFSFT